MARSGLWVNRSARRRCERPSRADPRTWTRARRRLSTDGMPARDTVGVARLGEKRRPRRTDRARWGCATARAFLAVVARAAACAGASLEPVARGTACAGLLRDDLPDPGLGAWAWPAAASGARRAGCRAVWCLRGRGLGS